MIANNKVIRIFQIEDYLSSVQYFCICSAFVSAVYVLCSIAKYVCAFFFRLFVHVSLFNGGLSQPPQTVLNQCYTILTILINSPQSQWETKIASYSSALVLLFIVQDKKRQRFSLVTTNCCRHF